MNKVGVICAGTGGTKIGSEAFTVSRRIQSADFPGALEYFFIETNVLPIMDLVKKGVPKKNLLLIGYPAPLGGRGSYNDPKLAAAALEVHKDQIVEWMSQFDILFIVATGGKGTGMGTFPLLHEWALSMEKWVFPVFAEPDLEGEIEANAHAKVLQLIEGVGQKGFRFVHIVNSMVFDKNSSLSKEDAFLQINESIGGALGSFAMMLAEGRKIDLSDKAKFMAGPGTLYLGHAERDVPDGELNPDYIRQAASEMAKRCLGVQYLRFEGAVDQAFWGITVPTSWPAWVRKEMRAAAGRELLEHFQKTPPKNVLPPADFTVDHGKWGITVLLSNDTGDHKPLPLPDLEFDLDEIMAEAPVPRKKNRARRPKTQIPVPSEPKEVGVSTQVTPNSTVHAEAVADEQATSSSEEASTPLASTQEAPPVILSVKAEDWTLGELLWSLSRGNVDALQLVRGTPEQIPFRITPSELRQQLEDNLPRFKHAASKCSPKWRSLLFEVASQVPLSEVKVKAPLWRTKSLRIYDYRQFNELSRENIAEASLKDFQYVANVVEVWHEDGYKACLESMGKSPVKSTQLPIAPAAPVTDAVTT